MFAYRILSERLKLHHYILNLSEEQKKRIGFKSQAESEEDRLVPGEIAYGDLSQKYIDVNAGADFWGSLPAQV